MKRLLTDKRSSFFSWGLYYKTLLIRNLWEMDGFRSNPVTFDLDKYTNLNKTSTLAYYGVRRLRIRNVFMVQVIGSYRCRKKALITLVPCCRGLARLMS
jgi:hypothetical protein